MATSSARRNPPAAPSPGHVVDRLANRACEGPVRRLVELALLVCLATCLHYVEGFFPPLPVPGARLGLANLVTTVALYVLGPVEALGVAITRSLLGSLLSGRFLGLGFAMSLAGATVSALAMAGARAYLRAAPVRASTAGGLVHNLTQAGVAYLVIGVGILPYLPHLVGLGLLAGWITGRVARPIIAAVSVSPAVQRPARPPAKAQRRRVGFRGALAAALLVVLGVAWLAGFARAGDHRDLVVELRNREVTRIPLDRDAPPRYLEVELPDAGGCRATIEVRAGRARILPIPERYCPRGICSHTGWIERPGQAAICLPNRLVIRVVARTR